MGMSQQLFDKLFMKRKKQDKMIDTNRSPFQFENGKRDYAELIQMIINIGAIDPPGLNLTQIDHNNSHV